MNKSAFNTLLLFFLGFVNPCMSTTPEIILANRNRITPETAVKDQYSVPFFFPRTNNLRRKTGSPFLAKGELLIIEGRVTDLLDIPIDNATIKIWQANHGGYYNYLVDENDTEKHDVDFSSAGMTNTDNLGRYSFITIMPGYYGHRTPHVHFLIEHKDFKTIETEMVFPNHPRNASDKKLQLMSRSQRMLITCLLYEIENERTEGKRAVFNIKLDGIHKRRKY